VLREQERDAVRLALRRLPPRHREVVERRYGLRGAPETLEAVGRELGVTRERVRQIEGNSLLTLAPLLASDRRLPRADPKGPPRADPKRPPRADAKGPRKPGPRGRRDGTRSPRAA
jgi:hypothetical protein